MPKKLALDMFLFHCSREILPAKGRNLSNSIHKLILEKLFFSNLLVFKSKISKSTWPKNFILERLFFEFLRCNSSKRFSLLYFLWYYANTFIQMKKGFKRATPTEKHDTLFDDWNIWIFLWNWVFCLLVAKRESIFWCLFEFC